VAEQRAARVIRQRQPVTRRLAPGQLRTGVSGCNSAAGM